MKNFIAAIFSILIMGTAQAQLINIDGTEYDILWDLGTFEEIDVKHNLQGQIWWGNNEVAAGFAAALGFFDDGDPMTSIGPLFATSMIFLGDIEEPGILVFSQVAGISGAPWFTRAPYSDLSSHGLQHSWAFVSNSVPVPSSLTLIALGLVGFNISRKSRF